MNIKVVLWIHNLNFQKNQRFDFEDNHDSSKDEKIK
jgi:hypothetical protein